MRVVAVAVLVAVLVAVVNADLEDQMTNGIGGIIKGAGKKIGIDVCDAEHIGAGVPFCPSPGMPQDNKFCCYTLGGEPACCNWLGQNLKVILIAAGVAVLLMLIGCCCCCYCCCCRRKSQQGAVIVMQSPPTQYPNHPHSRLNEVA